MIKFLCLIFSLLSFASPSIEGCNLLNAIAEKPVFDQHVSLSDAHQKITDIAKKLGGSFSILGEGRYGGVVYRLKDEKGFFVLKNYKYQMRRDTDLRLLKIAKRLESEEAFFVPHAEAFKNQMLILDYVEGQTLRDYILDHGADSEQARVAREIFDQKAMAFIKGLMDDPNTEYQSYKHHPTDSTTRSRNFFGDPRMDGTLTYEIRLDGHRFWIKSDNIIIDKNGDMHMIDPF